MSLAMRTSRVMQIVGMWAILSAYTITLAGSHSRPLACFAGADLSQTSQRKAESFERWFEPIYTFLRTVEHLFNWQETLVKGHLTYFIHMFKTGV